MAYRVTTQFWEALDDKQQDELRRAAEGARVNIQRIIPEDRSLEAQATPA
jgi:hypothetical protein